MICSEIGRSVFGPDATHRSDELGRFASVRPLVEPGRWMLGDYAVTVNEIMDIVATAEFNPIVEAETVVCVPSWDILKMMPRKFQVEPMMADYLNSVNTVVNAIACKIDALDDLIDVDTCPKKYLGHLASLIGARLKNQNIATVQNLRNQIRMAVEIYKIKGTYEMLSFAFYILGLNATIWDLYTRDYQNFTRYPPHFHSGIVPGFNPVSGLRSDDGWNMDNGQRFDGGGGFKSPHFDLVIPLNKLFYIQGAYLKLFDEYYNQPILEILEEFTPINTVPHVFLNLYSKCSEVKRIVSPSPTPQFYRYVIDNSQIKTCLTDSWVMQAQYFDQDYPDDIYTDQPGEDLLMGVGDGLNQDFTVTVAPARRAQPLDVQILLDVDVAASDNGAGVITGPGVTGTVVYGTGVTSVHFAVAPGAGQNVWFHSLVNRLFMDQNETTKLAAITMFKVGTGNVGNTPHHSTVALQNPVYTGVVDSYAVDPANNKVSFFMTLPPGITIDNITEVGLFIPNAPDLLMVAAFMPAWDKPSRFVGEIQIDVYRQDLGLHGV